ncbi:hypothetical protein [Bosea sp. TND4EK4]|uniref:hypothetical protein n=1 Tax=Bosea sp. TND4EK4 TaxID=1907408 RepID=UPI0011156D1B|nr:hypothetical protein [Bosea sp. TND4EK4]
MRCEGEPRRGNRVAIGQVEIDDEHLVRSRADAVDIGGIERVARAPDRERALQRLAVLMTIADEDDDGTRTPARSPDGVTRPLTKRKTEIRQTAALLRGQVEMTAENRDRCGCA